MKLTELFDSAVMSTDWKSSPHPVEEQRMRARSAGVRKAAAVRDVWAGRPPRYRRLLLSVLSVVSAFSVVGLALVGHPGSSQASRALPCDIYGDAGTPCVAAHSTVRALFSSYDGPLYRVRRASDAAGADIGVVSVGRYADTARQDAFCAGTSCRITEIYDQTSHHNDLTAGPAGTSGMGADRAADASEIAVTAGGHKVYGLWISPGVGYRSAGAAADVAVNGQAEGAYMVASGTHVGSACCFDYGNAERTPADTGNGHMDAVSLSTTCSFAPCTGAGPWVEADLENGMFLGGNGSNTANRGNSSAFVTAMLKSNGQTRYALKGGDSRAGHLSTWWDGGLPTRGGYRPLHQEGGIILGTGGDNSNWNRGTFFEGALVSGYPAQAAENAVQANLVSVGYAGETNVPNGPQAPITGPGGKCVDVAADDTGGDGAPVQLWDCQSYAEDQHWTHGPDGSLSTIGRCLDVNATAAGTQARLWDCDGLGGQKWVRQADGSLRNPRSGRCLDSPGDATADGTRLQLRDCDGSPGTEIPPGTRQVMSGPAR
jgi:hypothetical protein